MQKTKAVKLGLKTLHPTGVVKTKEMGVLFKDDDL